MCRHGACTMDFNEVIHCVKTKLDNFIAMALARSTSIIFHYVNFPSLPSSRRSVFSVIDRLGACTKHSRKLCLAAVAKFRAVRINVASIHCARVSVTILRCDSCKCLIKFAEQWKYTSGIKERGNGGINGGNKSRS